MLPTNRPGWYVRDNNALPFVLNWSRRQTKYDSRIYQNLYLENNAQYWILTAFKFNSQRMNAKLYAERQLSWRKEGLWTYRPKCHWLNLSKLFKTLYLPAVILTTYLNMKRKTFIKPRCQLKSVFIFSHAQVSVAFYRQNNTTWGVISTLCCHGQYNDWHFNSPCPRGRQNYLWNVFRLKFVENVEIYL